MKEEELINILNKKDKIEIQLKGIINLNLIIENAKSILEPEKIEIINQKEESNKLAFDRHQLMKIENAEGEIKLIFDQLQTALIKNK